MSAFYFVYFLSVYYLVQGTASLSAFWYDHGESSVSSDAHQNNVFSIRSTASKSSIVYNNKSMISILSTDQKPTQRWLIDGLSCCFETPKSKKYIAVSEFIC